MSQPKPPIDRAKLRQALESNPQALDAMKAPLLGQDTVQTSPHSGVNWTILDIALPEPFKFSGSERVDDGTERFFYEGGERFVVERVVTDPGFPPHYLPNGRRLLSSAAAVRWRWFNADLAEPRSLTLDVFTASHPCDGSQPMPPARTITAEGA